MSTIRQALQIEIASDLTGMDAEQDGITITALGWSTIGDGLGGVFMYVAGDTTTPVTGYIISAPNGRWRKIFGVSYYNASGVLPLNIKRFVKIHTPSTGNGESIDISAAGFSTLLTYNVIAIKNNSTANLNPNVAIKSASTTALVVNIVEGNAATVTILGISVLSGAPLVFANTTGLTLAVEVVGY